MLHRSFLFFQKERTVDNIPDHVFHPVAIGLQLQSTLFQLAALAVGQTATGSVNCLMFQKTEGDLINPIIGEMPFQIVRAAHLRMVEQNAARGGILVCQGADKPEGWWLPDAAWLRSGGVYPEASDNAHRPIG